MSATELDWGEEYMIRGVDRTFPGQHIAAAMCQYNGVEIEYPWSGEPCRLSVPLLGVSTEVVLMNAMEFVLQFTNPSEESRARVARWFADKYGESPR